jgi:hypothetical protein
MIPDWVLSDLVRGRQGQGAMAASMYLVTVYYTKLVFPELSILPGVIQATQQAHFMFMRH